MNIKSILFSVCALLCTIGCFINDEPFYGVLGIVGTIGSVVIPLLTKYVEDKSNES